MELQLCTQMSVWQQGYQNNIRHIVWMFWLTSGRSLHLFPGTFIVDFEYYLFIVNATWWHVFVENQKGVMFMGVFAKHLASICANDQVVP